MFQNSDAGIAKVIKRSTVVWRKYKGTTEVQDSGKVYCAVDSIDFTEQHCNVVRME